jgi:hypothetical protein
VTNRYTFERRRIVQRRVRPNDFERARRLRTSPDVQDVWWVCDDYEIRDGKVVARYPATSFGDGKYYPVPDYALDEGWRSYRPLEETPDLFLRFARLYEESNFDEAALIWSRKYGLPGGTLSNTIPRGQRPDSMSIKGFWEEVKKARFILRMYEAALNRDPQAVQALLADSRNEGPNYPRSLGINEESPFGYCENELQLALYGAIKLVHGEVDSLCSEWLVVEGEQRIPDPSRVRLVRGFSNLLGAMYLQMYWLMSSGGDAARCEHCHELISLARPHPEGRKRRRDKRFCDDACRQAHHRSKRRSADGPS